LTSPTPVTKINTAERVANQLRQAIRQAELLPGEHVRQEVWADRLGVSRVPVREALKTLAGEQLLLHDPNRGYFVMKVPALEMVQIYRMRILLEPEVLRSGRRPEPEEISHLTQQLNDAVCALDRRGVADWMEIDRQFYFTIYDLSPLTRIVTEVKRLWSMADTYRSASMANTLQNDPQSTAYRRRHKNMIDALSRHDHKTLVGIVLRERTELLDKLGNQPTDAAQLLRG
jgi:DNA-binding GntR family transcriptional regulator